ncbi:hypothetical protein AQUCO_03400115v1 [Aquilegia coerulea]|uniref:non-specific serine/threonine protein kinase n=1 Tax=Aquilegia coerulea TaxID=218851 RepID=A0A2G5CXJ8_AQUCA|nr:hypothetical protein AQUCO_03400115v1 [Aquilegia coerulea]
MFQLISILVVVVIIFSFIFNSLLVITSAAGCQYSGHTCRNGVRIRYPFWYQISDSRNTSEIINYCGYQGLLEIKCRYDDGRAFTNISDHLYYVLNIDYGLNSIKLVDVDVDGQDCPHLKRKFSPKAAPSLDYPSDKWTLFYNCSSSSSRYGDDDDKYVDNRIPCLDYYYKNNTNSTTTTTTLPPLRSYAFNSSYDFSIPNWYDRCEETLVTLSSSSNNYTQSAKFGFDLRWSVPIGCQKCEDSRGLCYYNSTTEGYRCTCYTDIGMAYDGLFCPDEAISIWLKIIIGVSTGVGGLLLSLFLLYKKIFHSLYHLIFSRWRSETKGPKNVEVLLESYGCLALQRYKYSDIVAMTKSFKRTLGQGGYGSVFKGTLPNDGRLVAVKVLNESKGNGEEFINEVATIGRTNHVNVVTLLGFCIERNKRALVYEFMPNGSLERFIYNEKTLSTGSSHLGWEKLYQIALGIAKGLEYLHCGCNNRILHFDIKPHNILLDQDFFPKISDFGLAKLCPTRETIVSMVGARGTMGYIAPEISCRNLGGVSHKSDVYSYGMMVLEMIGGRKNLDVTVENISGIYFPHWIYNQLKQDSKVEGPEIMKLEGVGEILKDPTAKKMIMVALWCIQTHPANRPSMTKVVEMLEASNEELQMPPNPSLDPLSLSSSSSS